MTDELEAGLKRRDPGFILRLLPPFTLKEAEVDLLSAALKQLG